MTVRARQALRDAMSADSPDERFRLAHLAALRAAGAVIADRGGRPRPRQRLQSAWVLLATVAPDLAGWSRLFAAAAPERAAIEAGGRSVVGEQVAAQELQRAETFLRLVEQSLGQIPVPLAS
ncbi:MAG: chromosome segregation protein SMC [Jatrophihabitans sp.]|nr:MAG: chromosome segregation protein SMC [Jatrophihabitans sp.]